MEALSFFIIGAIFGAGVVLLFFQYTEHKRRNMKEHIMVRLGDTSEDSKYIHIRPLDENFEPVVRPLTEEEFKKYESIIQSNLIQR